tara:strand:+ start:25394 stop:26308 length:915 start_codon:yes stop_codon:yes gene_type:complete
MDTIIVTGGAGFIGSYLVDLLIVEGYHVIVIDNLCNGNINNINPRAVFIQSDINSPELINKLQQEVPSENLKNTKAMFHYAALINANESFSKSEEYNLVNVKGTKNMLELCHSLNIPKFIYASSGGAIYGNQKEFPCDENHPDQPLNPYGKTKIDSENIISDFCKKYKIQATILRYSNVYGKRQKQGVISIFIDKLEQNKSPLIFNKGSQTRDFIFVKDVIDINLKALQLNKPGTYNISTGKETSINEVFKILTNLMHIDIKPIIQTSDVDEVQRSCLSNKKVVETFDWKPKIKLERGLNLTTK